MNRAEFMRNLTELLVDVSPAEREEAIQYYNDYFDDAGVENEQSVIASLGSPEQLAKTIKAGLADGGSTGEFTEKGFSGYEQPRSNEVLNPNRSGMGNEQEQNTQYGRNDQFGQQQSGSQYWQGYGEDNTNRASSAQYSSNNSYTTQGGEGKSQNKKSMSGGQIALIVLLCILASPFILGIGGGALGVILGVLGSLFGIVVGFGAAAVVLLIVGVCLFVYGITLLFSIPLGGLCTIGAAMVCMALGLFFLWMVVIICGALIPAIIRGIVNLFQSIFHRGGKTA